MKWDRIFKEVEKKYENGISDDCYCRMWFDNRGGSLPSTHHLPSSMILYFSAYELTHAAASSSSLSNAVDMQSVCSSLSLQSRSMVFFSFFCLNNSFAYNSIFFHFCEFEWCLWCRCCLEIESCWARSRWPNKKLEHSMAWKKFKGILPKVMIIRMHTRIGEKVNRKKKIEKNDSNHIYRSSIERERETQRKNRKKLICTGAKSYSCINAHRYYYDLFYFFLVLF